MTWTTVSGLSNWPSCQATISLLWLTVVFGSVFWLKSDTLNSYSAMTQRSFNPDFPKSVHAFVDRILLKISYEYVSVQPDADQVLIISLCARSQLRFHPSPKHVQQPGRASSHAQLDKNGHCLYFLIRKSDFCTPGCQSLIQTALLIQNVGVVGVFLFKVNLLIWRALGAETVSRSVHSGL